MSATTTIVIAGGTGDLTKRKLLPALFNLRCHGRLPENTNVVAFARSELDDDGYRELMWEGVKEFADLAPRAAEWREFAKHLYYLPGDLNDPACFERLRDRIETCERGSEGADRLFYLSLAPDLHGPTIERLSAAGLNVEDTGWRRIVIEKPFGLDLRSAAALNATVKRSFREDQTFRIDHYLGKETVQNLLVLRFANSIFEPLWSREHIDNVQITVAETVGVGTRAGYYDSSGVVRDMMQNHLLQLMSIVAMEPPSTMEADAIRDKKVDVVETVRRWPPDQVLANAVAGQYRGYLDEHGVSSDSRTPTFAALRLFVDNWRWEGVPFYLRSGKAMTHKVSEIVINFKRPPMAIFPGDHEDILPNALGICIQPDEGVHLRLQTKIPDQGLRNQPRDMEFHYETAYEGQRLPEAYERLLEDALSGDASLFIRGDWVERAWEIVAPLIDGWEDPKWPGPTAYDQGSWGPKAAEELLTADGRVWNSLCLHD